LYHGTAVIKPDKAKSPQQGIPIHREGLEAIAGLQTAINRLPHISKKKNKLILLKKLAFKNLIGLFTKKPIMNKHDRLYILIVERLCV